MANTINADNGVLSGITGIRTTADNTGNLALQSNGVTLLTATTANTLSVSNVATLSISGATSGAVALAVPAVAGTNTVTIPAFTGNVVVSDSSGNTGFGVANSTTYRVYAKGSGTSNAAYVHGATDSAGAVLFQIRNDGYFQTGVGAFSPYNYTTGNAANLFIEAGGGLVRSTSSLKYKHDVKDAYYGLAEVLKLRPVTYKAKNDGNKVFGGLIAEEVDAAGLIEFVQYAEDGTPDALSYGNMVSLCIKAIQELNTKIDALEAQLGVK